MSDPSSYPQDKGPFEADWDDLQEDGAEIDGASEASTEDSTEALPEESPGPGLHPRGAEGGSTGAD